MKIRLLILAIICVLVFPQVAAAQKQGAKVQKPTAAKKSAASAKKNPEAAAGEDEAATAEKVVKKPKLTMQERTTYKGFEARRDPFGAPPQVEQLLKKPEKLLGIKQDIKVKLPPIDLQGIIWSKSRPQVIVNSKVMQAGDFIGEFEIKEITQKGIILFLKGQDYFVEMGTEKKRSGSKR